MSIHMRFTQNRSLFFLLNDLKWIADLATLIPGYFRWDLRRLSLLYNNYTINTSNKFNTLQGYYLISSPRSHFSYSPKKFFMNNFKITSDPGSNPRLHWISLSSWTFNPEQPSPLWSFIRWYSEVCGPVILRKDPQYGFVCLLMIRYNIWGKNIM